MLTLEFTIVYFVIVIEEHMIFREGKWSNYDFDSVGSSSRLPMGLAALFALGCGIAGAVLGMANVWYVGVIAKQIGLPQVRPPCFSRSVLNFRYSFYVYFSSCTVRR